MSKKSTSTSYGKKECKDAVWNTAFKISDKDPSKYRLDSNHHEIHYDDYGKNKKVVGKLIIYSQRVKAEIIH